MCRHDVTRWAFLSLFLGIEVKSGNTLAVIKEAATQNKIRNQLLGRWHSDILSPDWTYERVVALPMVQSLSEAICASCRPYVLDQTKLKKGLKNLLTGSSKELTHPVDHQYKNLLTRNQLQCVQVEDVSFIFFTT